MSRISKWLIPIFLFVCPSLVHAQSCTAASCAATDCTRANVLAALPSSSNTNATVTVTIPVCTATGWTTHIVYTVPAAVTQLTVQGQTTCTGTGDPSASNLACTDNTIIQDNDTTDSDALFAITSSGFVRVTGLTIQKGPSDAQKTLGTLTISAGNGLSCSGNGCTRVDHNHFNADTGHNDATALLNFNGCTFGVTDHNIFTNDNAFSGFSVTLNNGVVCGGSSFGDWIWNQPTDFGGADFMFVEDNLFVDGGTAGASQANDCQFTGKQVLRFNSLKNGAHFQTHPTDSAGRHRGCRGTEIYGNNWHFTLASGNFTYTLFFYSSGPALLWGNTINQNGGTAGYQSLVALEDCRSPVGTSRCGYPTTAPPNGWGACVAGNNNWDGNSVGGTPYPCIDQATRGQSHLLSGNFPNVCDQTLGCSTSNGQWPHNMLEPLYLWLNAFPQLCCGNSNGYVQPNGGLWTQNQDWYISSNPGSGTDCTGFTGTTGVGCGARSTRPSNCTAGPGGTYGQSPTGSYGVAWFATDQGSWNTSSNGFGNGVLDICTATNTWTDASYTPYHYPHPLTLGSGTATAPAAPTNLQAVVN